MSTPTIKDIRAAAAARRNRRRNIKRTFIGLGVTIGLGVIGLVFAAPSIIREQLESRGGEFLQRSVVVEKVRLNPFKMAITVEGLRVEDHDGELLVGWDRFMVDGKVWATLTGSWAADAVELDGLQARLAIDETGRLNVADILESLPESGDEPSRPLDLGNLVVRDARVGMTDASRSRPFATELGPLSFSLENFHTRYDPQAPYQFEAETELGERLTWIGALSLSPINSEGEFAVEGISLPKYAAYFDPFLPFEVEAGAVSAEGEYALTWTEELPALRLWNGEVVVDDLMLGALEGHEGHKTVAEIDVRGMTLDLKERQMVVEEVSLTDGAISLRRTEEGIDWMGLLLAAATSDAPTVESQLEQWGEVELKRVVAERLVYRLEDQTLTEPTELGIDVNSVVLENLMVTDLASPVTVQLAASLPLGGTLSVTGMTKVQPLEPDLAVEAEGVDLAMLRNHLQALTGVELERGGLALSGRVEAGNQGLVFRGDSSVTDLWLLDGDQEPLGGFERLDLNQMMLATEPMAGAVEQVVLTRPEGHVRIAEDGTLNLLEMMPAESMPVAASEEGNLPALSIGRIEVLAGRMTFRDDSLARPASLSVDEVSGTLNGWSSEEVAKASVEMAGKINAAAPFTMAGDLNPLGRPAYADMQIAVEGMDLVPTGGYVGKYAGYELTRGDLTLDIEFHLHERAIDSATVTVLDQFTLGAKTNSPDATKLPVGLGVSLLKDKKGEIVIDVPVAGHLDDPEFRISRVVWRVIGNLLTKVATSPFALLGAAVGGSGEVDLEHHAFVPGLARAEEETKKNLATVLSALLERPQVVIGVQGEYDPVKDGEALRPTALELALRERADPERFDATRNWQPLAREAALVEYYEEVFGEPPLDPAGEVPPMPEPIVEEVEAEVETTEPGRRSLFAWLGDWLRGDSVAPEVVEPPVETEGAFPVPEGVEVELAALPVEEITERLLAEVVVDEQLLTDLALARTQVARDYLISAGLPEERVVVLDPTAGSAQVTLDLR